MTVSFHLAHSPLVSGIFGYNLPAAIVLAVSIVIGFLMVIVFGYTSDQKAIKHAERSTQSPLACRTSLSRSTGRGNSLLRRHLSRGTGRYLVLASQAFARHHSAYVPDDSDRPLSRKYAAPASPELHPESARVECRCYEFTGAPTAIGIADDGASRSCACRQRSRVEARCRKKRKIRHRRSSPAARPI